MKRTAVAVVAVCIGLGWSGSALAQASRTRVEPADAGGDRAEHADAAAADRLCLRCVRLQDLGGLPTSHTGPIGLTTTWSYDGFGRKILEVRADGTQSQFVYSFCNGVNGGTASCPAGAVRLSQANSLAPDGTTPNAPTAIVSTASTARRRATHKAWTATSSAGRSSTTAWAGC